MVPDGWIIDEKTGEAKLQRRTIGYYPDKKSAMMALAEYNKNPSALGTANVTFKDVYDMWSAEHFKNISEGSVKGWENAFNHSAPLHAMKMKDIRTKDMSDVMSTLTVGPGRQKIIKSLWLQVFRHAIEHDIVQKNYAEFVNTKDKEQPSKRKPFTDSEISLLWESLGTVQGVDSALILIYTGMRPTELLEIKSADVDLGKRLMVGGIKTKAGKNRFIPICTKILPLIENRLKDGGEMLMVLRDEPMDYHRYKYNIWDKMAAAIGLDHTPHECRHTGVSLMRRAGIDKDLVKLIVGHSSGDVTDRYIHTKPEALAMEIEKLNQFPKE